MDAKEIVSTYFEAKKNIMNLVGDMIGDINQIDAQWRQVGDGEIEIDGKRHQGLYARWDTRKDIDDLVFLQMNQENYPCGDDYIIFILDKEKEVK